MKPPTAQLDAPDPTPRRDDPPATDLPAVVSVGHLPRPAGPLPVASVRSVGRIKLVAVDLDGTLLDSQKQVGVRTVRALKHLPAIGVQLVIASARPPRSVRHIYRALGLDNWQINYNGAVIWDEGRREAVYHQPIAGDLARAMVEAARTLVPSVVMAAEVLDRWHTDSDDNRGYTTETGKLFRPDVVEPVGRICASPVTKLMFLGPRDDLATVDAALSVEFGGRVTVLHAEPELIQVMHRRVGKGFALAKVAGHYGARREEVMAIGDAPNDLGMVKWAGTGVAMDNAFEVVKSAADWVAPSNDDHGVLAALQRYGLVE